MENALDLLSDYDYKEDGYIGRAGEWGNVKYCGGGAGYFLSQKTLSKWLPHIDGCPRLAPGEDVSVGKCLKETIDVNPTWKTGFYHKVPEFFFTTAQGKLDHPEGLTPRPITFHSVKPEHMYELDYLCHFISTPLASLEEKDRQWLDPWPTSKATH